MLRASPFAAPGLLVSICLFISGCDGEPPTPDAGPAPRDASTGSDAGTTDYVGTTNWMCHSDLAAADDICRNDLDATVVAADGSSEIVAHVVATDPTFDCLYIYPTVSSDRGGNSDLDPDEELFATRSQAARFSSVCRVFAPIYRQATLAALVLGAPDEERELAYGDVRAAYREYMSELNDGRGVVVVGHSQGARHLLRLVQEEIEPNPAHADRMIAAYLLGTTVAVPPGEVVGGSFVSTPLCERPDQTGCVVTYASFRASDPPTASSRFADTGDPSTVAGCNHPAALGGGPAVLDGYFSTEVMGVLGALGDPASPYADRAAFPALTTPFYQTPGLVTAECVVRNDHTVLEITVNADASDPRADDIGGDFQDGWGLHLVDVSLAQGDLVALASSQAEAWLGR